MPKNNEKIKVVMLAPYFTRSEHSGAVMHVHKLAEHLSYRDDIELHVVTFGDENRQFKKGDLTVHVMKSRLYRFCSPSLAWPLKRKTIEINPDIVHAEGSFAPHSTAAVLLQKRYPTLLTMLGVVRKQIKFCTRISLILLEVLINKPNERYVVSKIPHIIVQSTNTKNLISGMTKSKIYIVPEGIKSEKIRNIQPHDINEDIDTFIAVGLTRLKGQDILINTIPTVIKSVPDLKVYIAGSGEKEYKLKSMVKDLGVEHHVKFLGYISDEEEINKYYKDCKIVVVPSRWDVEPFAPLNAAAAGKPAIVSDMCNSSVIEDGKTGFVFKSDDVEELSSKMVKLLTDDKLREEMGKAAMEKVKEYDWSKIVDKKVEIYKEVIADFHERKRRKKENGKHL